MNSKKHISTVIFVFGAVVLVLAAYVAVNFQAALFVAILLLGGLACCWRLLERANTAPDRRNQARKR